MHAVSRDGYSTVPWSDHILHVQQLNSFIFDQAVHLWGHQLNNIYRVINQYHQIISLTLQFISVF